MEVRMSVKNTGSFKAIGDDELDYIVHIYQDQIVVETLNGRHYEDGLKDYQLNNGDKLNKLANGKYQIVRTGVIVTPV